MKLSTVFLVGSLAANAALVVLIVAGTSSDSERAPAAPIRPGPRAAPNAPVAVEADAVVDPGLWLDLHSDDLHAQVDRLRAAGFPPALLRAILTAQIRESFAARRKALEASQGDTPFWKNPVRDPKLQAALRDIAREEENVLKDLLGRDARNDDPAYTASLRRQFGDLPDQKIDQLRRIQEDYNNQRSDIFANVGAGGLLPEEGLKLNAIEKAMHADFAAVLTPEELLNYDLRSSSTAQNLRNRLIAFDASEQEFRALFQLQQAFDDQWGQIFAQPTPEESRARNNAEQKLNLDVKAALGDQRYADYQRASDYNYRQTTQLVARLELPPETANDVYAVQQDIQQRMRSLQTARPPTPAIRNQQLTALAEEAKLKITASLGERGFEAYKQYGGGWLQNVAPRPPPAPPPRPPGP